MAAAQGVIEDTDTSVKSAIAATTFLLYDAILNVADEYEYVWSRGGRWVKYAYAFVRHTPYLAQGSIIALNAYAGSGRTWHSGQCFGWNVWQVAYNEVLTIVVEAIFIVRINILYNRNRVILAVVLALYVAEIIAMITLALLSKSAVQFTAQCLVSSAPVTFTSYWTVSLGFETVLFGLMLVKFFTSISTRVLGRDTILSMVVRDGVWAYAAIFGIMLANTLMFHLSPSALTGLFFV